MADEHYEASMDVTANQSGWDQATAKIRMTEEAIKRTTAAIQAQDKELQQHTRNIERVVGSAARIAGVSGQGIGGRVGGGSDLALRIGEQIPETAPLVQRVRQRQAEIEQNVRAQVDAGRTPRMPAEQAEQDAIRQRMADSQKATLAAQTQATALSNKATEAERKRQDDKLKADIDEASAAKKRIDSAKKIVASEEERERKRNQRENDRNDRNAFGSRLERNLAASRPGAIMETLAGGDSSALVRNMAMTFVQTLAGMGTSGRTVGALGGSTAAVGASGTTSAEEQAAASAAGSSGLMGKIGGIVEKFSGLLAVAGVLLYDDKLRVSARSEQATLQANIGGAGSGKAAHDLLDDIIAKGNITSGNPMDNSLGGQGFRFLYTPEQTMATTQALGNAGIPLPDIHQNLQNTMALAAAANVDPTQIAGLTGTMAVKGGLNPHQISQAFQELIQQANDTQIPLANLTATLKDMYAAGAGANMTMDGLREFAAVQKMMGQGISAGTAIGGVSSLYGAQAVGLGAVLGIGTDKFAYDQRHPAALIADVGKFAQSLPGAAGGATTTTNREMIAEVLKNMGLLNLMGVQPKDQDDFMKKLLTNPQAAIEMSQKMAKDQKATGGIQSDADFYQQEIARRNELLTSIQKLALEAQYATQNIGNMDNQVSNIYGDLKNMDSALRAVNQDLKDNHTLMDQTNRAVQQALATPQTPGGPPNPGSVLNPGANPGIVPNRGPLGGPSSLDDPSVGFPYGTPTGTGGGAAAYSVSNTRGNMDRVPANLIDIYKKWANVYHVPLGVGLAVGARESDFINSPIADQFGSRGLAQFTTSTINDELLNNPRSPFYHKKYNPMDPNQAIQAENFYLSDLASQHGGDWRAALTGYNGSPTYGQQVYDASQNLQIEIRGTLHDPGGSQVGTIDPSTTNVTDPHRKAKGSKAAPHAPTPVPPARRGGGSRSAPRPY